MKYNLNESLYSNLLGHNYPIQYIHLVCHSNSIYSLMHRDNTIYQWPLSNLREVKRMQVGSQLLYIMRDMIDIRNVLYMLLELIYNPLYQCMHLLEGLQCKNLANLNIIPKKRLFHRNYYKYAKDQCKSVYHYHIYITLRQVISSNHR